VAETPQGPPPPASPERVPPAAPVSGPVHHPREKAVHEINFVTYPKLLFIWPLVLAGFVLYPFAYPGHAATPATSAGEAAQAPSAGGVAGQPAPVASQPPVSHRLEVLGWIYLWVLVLVLLTLGVDVERNMAVFWVVLVVGLYVLGLWLRDVHGFTLFGNIYRWFGNLDVQYDRRLGLAVSIVLAVPYVLMLLWAHINDRWRITHNEFEHYTFGKMNDSLGRGAKTIRTDFPDVFELLLGLAGTLIVYNASGTKELRRIPHVMFLPFIRRRLNTILETTAVTASQAEEEEDDENA
jgi:hypothetical protein